MNPIPGYLGQVVMLQVIADVESDPIGDPIVAICRLVLINDKMFLYIHSIDRMNAKAKKEREH